MGESIDGQPTNHSEDPLICFYTSLRDHSSPLSSSSSASSQSQQHDRRLKKRDATFTLSRPAEQVGMKRSRTIYCMQALFEDAPMCPPSSESTVSIAISLRPSSSSTSLSSNSSNSDNKERNDEIPRHMIYQHHTRQARLAEWKDGVLRRSIDANETSHSLHHHPFDPLLSMQLAETPGWETVENTTVNALSVSGSGSRSISGFGIQNSLISNLREKMSLGLGSAFPMSSLSPSPRIPLSTSSTCSYNLKDEVIFHNLNDESSHDDDEYCSKFSRKHGNTSLSTPA